jgi:hypothetical protein
VLSIIASILMMTLYAPDTLASAQPSPPKTITVGLDASRSNPLLLDKQFNINATNYVLSQLSSLDDGDKIDIKLLGSLQAADNLKSLSQTIGRNNKGKVAKAIIQHLTQDLPTRVKPQSTTNIIAFLEQTNFACRSGGHVILITDGIEASSYMSPNDLLSGKKSLPKPSEFAIENLRGCRVTFYGIGVGRSGQESKQLRRQWKVFITAAKGHYADITGK